MKLNWEIKDNVIYKLFLDGINIIEPWGMETADSSAFYSLEDGNGYLFNITKQNFQYNENYYSYNITSKMKEGKWELNGEEFIVNDKIIRKAEMICLEDSFFMDFVMRFRFKKEFIDYVEIDNNKIYFTNSNVYHQYPVNKVLLSGEHYDIEIKIMNSNTPKNMKNYIYARDNGSNWIVHIRMLPNEWDKEVIKLCNSWYDSQAINNKLSSFLLKFKNIKDFLWYHNEKKPYKNKILKFINPNAFPMVKLKANTNLMWNVETSIKKSEKNKVSIIIPTYNRPDLLKRLLDSIKNQTFKDYEVIVIDDCSNNFDQYKKVISIYEDAFEDFIFLRNEKNRGACFSRNKGIKTAKYEYIALVDDDDEWLPDKLSKQINLINNSNHDVGLVYTWTKAIKKGEVVHKYNPELEGELKGEILEECFIPSPSVLVKKKALIEAGMFDEKMVSCQDWDMWTRIIFKDYKCKVVKSYETLYHKHEKDSIGKSKRVKSGYKRYYRKHWKLYFKKIIHKKNFKDLLKYILKVIRG